MNNITFTFSTDEANLLLEALGQLPYVRSYTLINKIQQGAAEQLQATENEPPKPVKK